MCTKLYISSNSWVVIQNCMEKYAYITVFLCEIIKSKYFTVYGLMKK